MLKKIVVALCAVLCLVALASAAPAQGADGPSRIVLDSHCLRSGPAESWCSDRVEVPGGVCHVRVGGGRTLIWCDGTREMARPK